MEVWKIVFHFILEIFHCIPFWHLPYSIPKFPFHSIPCPGCRFYIIIATFYPDGCSRLKIRKRLILKKLLPLPAPFQHFRFWVRFRFQPLSSKCFRFHKKLTASTSLVYNDGKWGDVGPYILKGPWQIWGGRKTWRKDRLRGRKKEDWQEV